MVQEALGQQVVQEALVDQEVLEQQVGQEEALGQALGQALVKWISMEVVDAKPVGRTESDEAIHLADYVKDVRLAGGARIRPLGI